MRRQFAGWILLLVLAFAFQLSPPGNRLEGALIDAQQRALRQWSPPPALGDDVVVVGMDEDDLASFPEPVALMHRELGAFLAATRMGGARAVGLDVALPERSFDAIIPGLDGSLLRDLLKSRRGPPVVLARTLDAAGNVRPIERRLLAIAGPDGVGLALFPRDADGVVRRFDEALGDQGAQVQTLVGALVRRSGARPRAGYVDFSFGPPFNPIALREVLALQGRGDVIALRRIFAGRVVVLGALLPNEDRVRVPLGLQAGAASDRDVPGVLLNAQALRAQLHGRIPRQAPPWSWVALLLAGTWPWLLARRPTWVAVAVALSGIVLFYAAAASFRAGVQLPLAGAFAALLLVLVAAVGARVRERLRERRLLRESVGASVSPAVLQAMLDGDIASQLGGDSAFVCVLFSDIRGFTTRSESMTAEATITLLNRYFERMVAAVHAEDGAIASFIGDGLMAVFGAPAPLPNPGASAFRAACAMHRELDALNAELATEGLAPIEIGVGLHSGDAVVGRVGARRRSDYTAIGDVPNVASRVESLTKAVGYRIVCTQSVRDALDPATGLQALGGQAIKGHTPVDVFGWGRIDGTS